MTRAILLIVALCSYSFVYSQGRSKEKKYPSLLWEITGKGQKKPSYLIGTMHVSSKLAFNLPDSFYHAIRQSDVVALETNPETWQEDMSRYDLGNTYGYGYGRNRDYVAPPQGYLTINTLKFYRYDAKIERSLYSNPSTINSLLYRSYGGESADFEEDTYLDMYIFQCGKKWGKKVAGVEDYAESMKLMEEAYKDAARDKTRKVRSYDDADDEYSTEKLQEAYRKGDLDLLDSINRYNSYSKAFDEKFLYRRNEIQADNIDSIIRSGAVLFVGVGAAHLPGERGVIELLRAKGYRLRPVKMGERAGRDKDIIDKTRVPVVFHTETAPDGLFTVDIPGKFYKFGEDGALDQRQYADMANGSYYMVTRIMTNAWMWSHTPDDVYRTVDSLLYENVPGKILSRTTITRNGYKGFDITNRTRRGDLQRYQIFITPFEVLFFKFSGNGDYVKNGVEAEKFFGSIRIREYQSPGSQWSTYSPSYGGFSADLPHEPYIGNDGSWIYDAEDRARGTHYRIIRSDIHNYNFIEEDSFDLGLMEESFMASTFIGEQVSRRHTVVDGYPALDGVFKDKKGAIYLVRFLIQGPHYYTLIARGKQETPEMNRFIRSFRISPRVYPAAREERDTLLYFTVQSHLPLPEKKIRLDIPDYYYSADEDEESEDDQLESGTFRSRLFENDSTGEKIYVSFFRAGRYAYSKDSSALDDAEKMLIGSDTTRTVRFRNSLILPNGTRVWETISSDTGSSRTLRSKVMYRDGVGFLLVTQSDTLSKPSVFVDRFFETFTPNDTLKGVNPFEKKSALFFEDFMSTDSVRRKRAIKHISDIVLDSTDLGPLKMAIASMSWSEKKYLDNKASLIGKLRLMPTRAAANYLKELYYALEDTVQLQYVALETLLQQETQDAYNVFRDIINNEAPVISVGDDNYDDYAVPEVRTPGYSYSNGNFLDELGDSLKLTRTILPDLLPLLNLDDYKSSIMEIVAEMIDSNLVSTKDYEAYFQKFLIEAKQELRKQSIAEKTKAIEKAEEDKEDDAPANPYYRSNERDSGNEDLSLYARLLIPFWDSHPQVQTLLGQMLRSNDKRLKYSTMMLMVRRNRPYPDSLLRYFGSLDDYRYEMYADLEEIGKPDLFPPAYRNHLDLGKSALLEMVTYSRPDSIIYIDRLPAEYKGKKGFLYFFKVKAKKDDLTWKLATVGLVPEDPAKFRFENDKPTTANVYASAYNTGYSGMSSFTGFTEIRFRENEDVMAQLRKQLKRSLYSKRKSAEEFYDDEDTSTSSEED
jgi:uncharacterized protein YbaP (TraB family)